MFCLLRAFTCITPASRCCLPTMQLSKVVFPHPLGPSNPYLDTKHMYMYIHHQIQGHDAANIYPIDINSYAVEYIEGENDDTSLL